MYVNLTLVDKEMLVFGKFFERTKLMIPNCKPPSFLAEVFQRKQRKHVKIIIIIWKAFTF